MKIAAIEAHPVRIPLRPEFRMITNLGVHETSDYVVVRLVTDDGLEGAGEATVMPRWSGETVWSAMAMIERIFAPALAGADLNDGLSNIAAIDQRMDAATAHNWFTKAAIEMACWDVLGKAAGKPVHSLLGGACRDLAVRCRFSLGAYEPERAAARARELVAQGFDIIKVKVGPNPQSDVARVRAVRAAIGPSVRLVLDANCGWDAKTAIETLHVLEDCDVSLMEQPTPDGDYASMAEVRRAVRPKVMADDMCFNLIHAKELIRGGCCDIISVYPGKNGGIRKTRQIADFTAEHSIACTIGSNLELDLATAAMGHVVVATPNLQVEAWPGDMLGPTYHEFSIAKNPIKFEGPLVHVPSGPGLGVEVDWQAVRASRCPEA